MTKQLNITITGHTGTGKTQVIEAITALLHEQGFTVQALDDATPISDNHPVGNYVSYDGAGDFHAVIIAGELPGVAKLHHAVATPSAKKRLENALRACSIRGSSAGPFLADPQKYLLGWFSGYGNQYLHLNIQSKYFRENVTDCSSTLRDWVESGLIVGHGDKKEPTQARQSPNGMSVRCITIDQAESGFDLSVIGRAS